MAHGFGKKIEEFYYCLLHCGHFSVDSEKEDSLELSLFCTPDCGEENVSAIVISGIINKPLDSVMFDRLFTLE